MARNLLFMPLALFNFDAGEIFWLKLILFSCIWLLLVKAVAGRGLIAEVLKDCWSFLGMWFTFRAVVVAQEVVGRCHV